MHRRAPEDPMAAGQAYAPLGESLRRLLPFFWRHWKKGAVAGGLILLSSLMAFPQPLIGRFAIDDAILGKRLDLLILVVIVSVGFAALNRIIGPLQGYWMTRYNQEFTLDIQRHLLDRVLRFPKAFFDKNQTGYLMSRLVGDIGGATAFFSANIVSIVQNVLQFAGGFVLLCYLEWRLAVCAVLTLPPMVLSMRYFSRRMHVFSHAQREESARLWSRFQETLASVPLIKAFATEDRASGTIIQAMKRLNGLSMEQAAVGTVAGTAITAVPSLAGFIVFVLGAYWVISGHWSLGTMFAFQAYLGYVFGPAQSLVSMNMNMQSARASLERLSALFEAAEEENVGKGEEVLRLKGEVEFRDVSFAYDPGNPVVRDISFRVQPGERVALVGPSGAGKTTILSLLLRFYNPTGGEILYDGKPAGSYEVRSLRRRIGYVSQSPVLLTGTIMENLRYGNPEASTGAVSRAARIAGIHDFIESLADGYDSEIGERGVNLSEGQKQRLSIARALVMDPDILILDEPSSALDGLTEESFFQALPEATQGKTLFLVAHRLSTVVDAERIFVLNENCLVAEGTHEELLRTSGYYRELVSRQLIPDDKERKANVIPYGSLRRHSRL
ncbi:MAG TPA: ABC transporter ATP-binding protein [Syntrophales bacterium]|nr:ABC transporter ATP-binding protein [Syntrophales bacterium]